MVTVVCHLKTARSLFIHAFGFVLKSPKCMWTGMHWWIPLVNRKSLVDSHGPNHWYKSGSILSSQHNCLQSMCFNHVLWEKRIKKLSYPTLCFLFLFFVFLFAHLSPLLLLDLTFVSLVPINQPHSFLSSFLPTTQGLFSPAPLAEAPRFSFVLLSPFYSFSMFIQICSFFLLSRDFSISSVGSKLLCLGMSHMNGKKQQHWIAFLFFPFSAFGTFSSQ